MHEVERISRGNKIAVEQDGDIILTGTVIETHSEFGRRGYSVITPDGEERTAWQQSGREIQLSPSAAELARLCAQRLTAVEEELGEHVGLESAQNIQEIRERLREIQLQVTS